MKPYNVLAIALFGMATASAVQAASFSYDHQYEDYTKAHTDELKLSQDFDSGVGVSFKLKFQPAEEESGDAGTAFKDLRWDETAIGLSYSYDVSDTVSVEPGVSLARKQDKYKYKPYLKVKYGFAPNWELSSRYRYEVTDYAYKETRHKNRFDAGISRKFDDLKVSYTYTYYRGDSELFDNKKNDYQQEVEFQYKVTKRFSPFVSFTNKSVSDDSDQRQTEFEVGMKYKI